MLNRCRAFCHEMRAGRQAGANTKNATRYRTLRHACSGTFRGQIVSVWRPVIAAVRPSITANDCYHWRFTVSQMLHVIYTVLPNVVLEVIDASDTVVAEEIALSTPITPATVFGTTTK
jgi:hypothetical protein